MTPTRDFDQDPGLDPTSGNDAERGSATVFCIIVSAAVVIALGLLVDAGEALAAKATAVEQAQQAARAGAEELVVGRLRAGDAVIDPARAVTAAEAFLHARGDSGIASVSGQVVTVAAQHVYRNRILSLFGLGTFTAHGTGAATLVPGIAAPGDATAPLPTRTGGPRP